jgi:tetratricopeptide (TPR) repeat protein
MSNKNILKTLNTALKLHQAGNLKQAEEIYRKILKTNPFNPDALHLLGVILTDQNNFTDAEKYIKKAIKISPSINYYISLANLYTAQNNLIEAINCYKTLLSFKPDYVEVYNIVGNLLSELGKVDEAIEYYNKSITINPDYIEAYYNFGNLLLNNDRIEEAKNMYNIVITKKSDYAEAYYNLGAAFHYQRNFEEAIKYYEKALLIKPNYIEVHYNLAIAYLIQKEFYKGWEIYRKIRSLKQDQFKIDKSLIETQWNSESIINKTIYVYHEQGLGDTIFSARYLPILNSFGAKVLIKPQKELAELFKQNDLKAEIIDTELDEGDLDFDTHISMYYLLSVLNINTDNIPFQSGYLKADKEKVDFYKQNYFNNNKFKLGIVWQGSPDFKNDKRRSVLLENFFKFANMSNIQLYSFQKGKGSEQLLNIPNNIEIIDLGKEFKDFSDTAAAVENLDLLISVDTSVAHLAGALGKPVWMLIPYFPDWRWFLDTEKCVWYNSLQIFRQAKIGNWTEVFERVEKSLEELCT